MWSTGTAVRSVVCLSLVLSFPWRLMNMCARDRWTPFARGSGCWRRKSDRDDMTISMQHIH
jgi:hypothetical protein